MSHHVGLAERPTLLSIAEDDFVRTDMANKLSVRMIDRNFVDNLDGGVDGRLVFEEE